MIEPAAIEITSGSIIDHPLLFSLQVEAYRPFAPALSFFLQQKQRFRSAMLSR
jgi:hypothetical protein